MKRIEAYQTSDGKKFIDKLKAERHEERLGYEAKVRDIENHLFDLLEIKKTGVNEDVDNRDGQLATMLMDEGNDLSLLYQHLCNVCNLFEDDIDLEAIIELIIDIATISDGVLLKTAQYAKEITASNRDHIKGKKIDKILAILLEYDRNILDGYDFSEDVEDMLTPMAERILKVAQKG